MKRLNDAMDKDFRAKNKSRMTENPTQHTVSEKLGFTSATSTKNKGGQCPPDVEVLLYPETSNWTARSLRFP